MLIEFTVGNFRSFRDPITFSMLAAPLKAEDPEIDGRNVFEARNGVILLKTAAIYGANASGKSNLVRALHFMRDFVLNSSRESRSSDPVPVEPFVLSPGTGEEPSFFEIVFLDEGTRFRYGFKVTQHRVIAEWLYRTATIRAALLFERDADKIEVGSSFKEGRGIEERTRDNALFLSVAAQFNGPVALKILKWFRSLVIQLGVDDRTGQIGTINHLKDDKLRSRIIGLVKKLDLGIEDIQLEQRPLFISSDDEEDFGALTSGSDESVVPKAAFEALQQFVRAMAGRTRPEARTVHRVYDEQGQQAGVTHFTLDEHESEGTKKLFGLAGTFVSALEHGQVMVIDELDARLHPIITCAIIDLFHDPEINPRNAQLVFTTHDTSLLRKTIFRRDQIWFVEKERKGASRLYSLAEFRVRNDRSFDKDYIHGRYGAIPFIGDLTSVLVQDDAT